MIEETVYTHFHRFTNRLLPFFNPFILISSSTTLLKNQKNNLHPASPSLSNSLILTTTIYSSSTLAADLFPHDTKFMNKDKFHHFSTQYRRADAWTMWVCARPRMGPYII